MTTRFLYLETVYYTGAGAEPVPLCYDAFALVKYSK